MKVELMRYRNDKISSMFNLIGLALNAIYLIVIYSAPNVSASNHFGKFIGIDILFNIVFLLVAFLTSEKTKTYALNWCWVSLVLGVLQIPRILFPIALFRASEFSLMELLLALDCLTFSCASFVIAAIFSRIKSVKLDKYLKEIEQAGE